MKRLLCLAALALVTMLFLVSIAEAQKQPTRTVLIQHFRFTPTHITVSQGTRVVWVNKDSAQHTATANNGSFDSGVLRQGQRYSRTFKTAGKKAYHCTKHSSMKGSVTVKPRQ